MKPLRSPIPPLTRSDAMTAADLRGLPLTDKVWDEG